MPPYEPPNPLLPWRLVCCPGDVRFSAIKKEAQTLGRLYALHRNSEDVLWLGQSLNVLARFMSKHYQLPVHCSSGYRVIRRESQSGKHKGFAVHRLPSVQELNALLDEVRPRWIAVALRDPEKWETTTATTLEASEPPSDFKER